MSARPRRSIDRTVPRLHSPRFHPHASEPPRERIERRTTSRRARSSGLPTGRPSSGEPEAVDLPEVIRGLPEGEAPEVEVEAERDLLEVRPSLLVAVVPRGVGRESPNLSAFGRAWGYRPGAETALGRTRRWSDSRALVSCPIPRFPSARHDRDGFAKECGAPVESRAECKRMRARGQAR